jgi:hypothetical protein
MRLFWILVIFFSLFIAKPVHAVIVPSGDVTPTPIPSLYTTITPSISPTLIPSISPTISLTPTLSITPPLGLVSPSQTLCGDIQVDENALGFKIPTFSDLLTFAIRGFFTIAGLAALFMLLMGAFAWVTSGGAKDAVDAAQKKISAALIGMIMIVVVLAIVWTMENVIFNRRICFGLSCGVTIPSLVEPTSRTPDLNCITGTPGPSPFATVTPPISGAEPLLQSNFFNRKESGQSFVLPETGK